ncbi:MAG: helix-turn-helix transcriptional regulator [Lachnospiraceae bacterium]|nr:helix-turn-helix transcriptional regulator [Lachnospiraceae bacterium]
MRIDRIKFYTELLRRSMTQKEFATLSGVSRVTINNVLNGKSCSQATAEKIAAALNINLSKITE